MPRSDQGAAFERYKVIPRTLIFVTRGDQVLLLMGASDKRLWANKYNGIGGHVERGEDIRAAAERELTEEAGVCVSPLWLCGTIMVDVYENTGICIFVFRTEYLGGALKPGREGRLRWVARDELAQLPLVDDLYKMLPKILAMTRESPPFSAYYSYDEGDRLQIVYEGELL